MDDEPLNPPVMALETFALDELSGQLADFPSRRRRAFEHASRRMGAFTVSLPGTWHTVIFSMPERARRLGERVVDDQGVLDPALDNLNQGSEAPIKPVWLTDRTRPRDGMPFMPLRSIFSQIQIMSRVYDDAGLLLGFLLQDFIRNQLICRYLEMLGIPADQWRQATGGAMTADWPRHSAALRARLDGLAAGLDSGPEWRKQVLRQCDITARDCECWNWASVNFFLFNEQLDLQRQPLRPIRDEAGNSGFAATLLVEHTDYDLVASVITEDGLQARDREGRWRCIEPGQLLINTGKAMQLLAGDRYQDGDIVGDSMRALPHRVMVTASTEAALRERLAAMRRRVSLVGVTEPHGEDCGLVTWDANAGELKPSPGLEHAAFWQFLTRQIPPPSEA